MKVKVTRTRTIIESWIEKNGKVIETFPTKETEYTEKEIEQEDIDILTDKGKITFSFPKIKFVHCSRCKEKQRIFSETTGLDNSNYCSECSLEIIKECNYSLKNPEVLDEIKETVNYLKKQES